MPESTQDDDLDADQVDAEVAARAEADQRDVERRAAIMAHPHTQLNGILKDLQAPAANQSDVNTRIAYLQSGLRRLTQIILTHTPPPPEEDHGEVQRIDEQPAQGAVKQEPAGS